MHVKQPTTLHCTKSKAHLLLIFIDGNDPSAQTLGCSGCILDLGRVKVRVGDILIADLGDICLWNIVLCGEREGRESE